MTGASIAHHLLAKDGASSDADGHKKLDVLMLEAREACWGATGRNGGHCQPLLFESPRDPSIGHFELANFHTLKSLVEQQNIDCEFHAQPGVRAIYSAHHLKEAEEALSIMETTAPELRKMMKLVTEISELAQYRIPTAKGAVVTEVAARMWPYKLVSHILERLLTSSEHSGSFNLQTLTPATSLTPNDDGHWTIQTDRGSIKARRVILATNAYTSHLLPSFKDLIVPCRGQMSALKPLPSLQGPKRLKTSLGFLGDGLDDYLIQRPSERGGHMMFGGGRQHGPSIGVTDDSVLDPKTAAYLRRRLVEALGLPEIHDEPLREFEAANEWTGIMGFSRDNHPFVGPVPPKYSFEQTNLYMAAGFTGHGMPNTWLSGAAVAGMVQDSLAASVAGGQSPDEARIVELARKRTGLPAAYCITEARLEAAMKVKSVEEQDWAEMERGNPTRGV
ncbi:hypothetical protein B0A50_07881 [Salinomyces thailandicus]|uniref:FAD dependent oxidoreductase domain-containing protein n=1 Tax=Salinomyces thailandicus TaxID=706561 RepID=A0A4V5N3A1_9PEZI|nr:hypothetical protein B0A50_07881 [Salinomyces thailandica]